MKYTEARKHIKTGDVLACQGTEWFSRLIRWYTGSEISHVGLAAWLRFGKESRERLCMYEAMDGGAGVRLLPITLCGKDYYKAGGQMWWCPIVDPSIDGNEVLGNALELWGSDFASMRQFIIIASPRLRRVVQKWRGTESADLYPDAYHCAEVVTHAFMRAGYNHPKEPVLTYPQDVINFKCLGPRTSIEFDDSVDVLAYKAVK